MAWLLELDRQAFLAINGWNSPVFDGIMWWVSGKVTWWPFYLAVLLFLGWKKRWGLVPLLVFVVLVIVATDQTSVHLFKNVFHRLRPCHEPLLEGMVHLVNGKCGGSWGFVSSHAANSGGVAVLLTLFWRKSWFASMMGAWAVLIAYSRVYLGVHYPGDVLAGLVWGALCGFLLFRAMDALVKRLPGHWWIVKGHTA